MSGIASNYNMSRLAIGISIASVALLLAIGSSLYALRGETLATVAPFAIMTLAYGGMMFASSYVEEEQHFWYWALSAWFVWTGIRATRGCVMPPRHCI
jgi:ethanolamine phosphate transferase 2 subunit G